MLKAIVAVSPEGIIAIDGKMPWNVSEDLQRFKRITINSVVIMGRKTFESIGQRPLPNRINFIISRKESKEIEDTTWFNSIDSAISEAQLLYPEKDIYIMGGASLYSQTLPICDELELTIIKREYVNYKEGERLYLKEFPSIIDRLFKERTAAFTDYATYKNYTRRTTNKIFSKGSLLT